jgi:ribosome recycling factor
MYETSKPSKLKKLTPFSTRTSLSHALSRKTIPQTLSTRRAFSQSPLLHKKKGRAEREKEEDAAEKSSNVVEDPFDFSTLESGIEKSIERLKSDLSKLRTGGRFNPEVLENVRVQLSKDNKATERLGDLAQVLPKGGRSLMVLVGEKDVSYEYTIR